MAKYEIVLTEEQNQIIKQLASKIGISEQELVIRIFFYGYNGIIESKKRSKVWSDGTNKNSK